MGIGIVSNKMGHGEHRHQPEHVNVATGKHRKKHKPSNLSGSTDALHALPKPNATNNASRRETRAEAEAGTGMATATATGTGTRTGTTTRTRGDDVMRWMRRTKQAGTRTWHRSVTADRHVPCATPSTHYGCCTVQHSTPTTVSYGRVGRIGRVGRVGRVGR